MAFDNVPKQAVATEVKVEPKHEEEVLLKEALQKQQEEDLKKVNQKFPFFININDYGIPLSFYQRKKSTYEILNEAADLIEEKGWGRGRLSQTKEDGTEHNFCIMGALSEVVDDYERLDSVAIFLSKILAERMYRNGYSFLTGIGGYSLHYGQNLVAAYNDSVAHDKKEVIDFLRHSARTAKYNGEYR